MGAFVPSFIHSARCAMPDDLASLVPFFRRAAAEAERSATRVRRVVLPLIALRLVAARWDEVLQGVVKHWWSLTVLALAMLGSELLVRQLLRRDHRDPILLASAVFDVVVAFLVLLPALVWPREGYPGFLGQPDWAVLPILAVSAGLRLTRPAAWAGAGAAALAMATLLVLDSQWNADQLVHGPGEVALAAVLMVAAALLGDAVARRARRLVREGALEAVRGERTRQRLGAYVSEEVAAVVADANQLDLGGSEREVAVLFSDLRGFTTYGEQLGADALVRELNAYLEALVPAVRRHGGVVDKYIGDAIMVVFGVPHPTGEEATRAIRAAADMQQALARHNEARAALGQPPLVQGVGVHFGRCVAGHIGTAERLQYTVVGDTVNVASRLEGATKDADVDVLISDATVQRAAAEGSRAPATVPVGRVPIRGRSGDQVVHTLAAGPPSAAAAPPQRQQG